MIFEIKNYQKSKQYKINGAVVRKSIFESAQELEKENKELKEAICIYVREHGDVSGIDNDKHAVTYFQNTFNENNYQ